MAEEKIKEGILGKMLRKPSPRTQLESSIVGITIMLLASLTSAVYVIFFSNYGVFWKIVSGLGEVGILLMMLSSLATTYVQLYSLKMSMGLLEGDNLMEMINQINTNSKNQDKQDLSMDNTSGEKVKLDEGKARKRKKKVARETLPQSIPKLDRDFTKQIVESFIKTEEVKNENKKEVR